MTSGDGLLAPVPVDLQVVPPRPLPRWAKIKTLFMLYVAAAATCLFASVTVALEGGLAAVVPLCMSVVFAVFAVRDVRRRSLLRTGTVARAAVKAVWSSRGSVAIEYEFDGGSGRVVGRDAFDSGRIVMNFGLWPTPGDTAFVMFDPRSPARSAIWGVSQQPGTSPRELPALDRPAPAWLLRVVKILAAGAAVSVVVRACLALRP